MLNFCTLFDSGYLARGLAMYHSLDEVCPSFHLYVFAFDEPALQYLQEQPLPHLTVISLAAFQTPQLLAVKPTRSVAEYCWTSTPFTILYCLEKYNLSHCTYIDADLFFYDNPQVLIDEMKDKSVLISEHRYPPLYDQSWYSGIYCVQFMCFRNDAAGLEVLHWWKDRCLEWCYARREDGKFGDQKYLDDWTTRFPSVHVLQNHGGGVAPWNISRYAVTAEGDGIFIMEKKTGKRFRLVFFHFHGLKFYAGNLVLLSGPLYEIDTPAREIIYFPYVRRLAELEKIITAHKPGIHPNGVAGEAPSQRRLLADFFRETINAFTRHIPGIFHAGHYNYKKHLHLVNLNDLQKISK